ncbi:hypothetical protein B296_00038005 [Ensete ventricosum]|uniref:Peptidase C19 ubiquitin carboxyl-terminal hydrolase domain-containing protein n=1 Tax=Ensete ventricosum TaxID=4639 RepID=A0A426YCR1_ENSVE|nr:hypothetical protein B296_00038005 [Ensete ventricosum]
MLQRTFISNRAKCIARSLARWFSLVAFAIPPSIISSPTLSRQFGERTGAAGIRFAPPSPSGTVPQTLEARSYSRSLTVETPSSTEASGTAAERGPERSRSGLGLGFRYLTGVAGGWWDKWTVMGAAGSKLEKALGDQFPEGERYFGLENFGNTCYCNSVLQVIASTSSLLIEPRARSESG